MNKLDLIRDIKSEIQNVDNASGLSLEHSMQLVAIAINNLALATIYATEGVQITEVKRNPALEE